MLNKIIETLTEQGSLSLADLSLALQSESSAIEPMLELLVKKGRVKAIPIPCGGGCSSCSCGSSDKMKFFAIEEK